ncbi:uncharacterized protein LOC131293195 [Anopheles ziemanni]|uniref:uncharacterized protein LOC131263403 n=1 Tax=Anopheles coustani TaxID=139045 RepID=UPI002658B6B3|nr:uncharacterized protein LOC131263403 [Anopheles coustani]XP_058177258.1 uncharacterized protein LOC131293195 [Anopheles ziemanni]
MQSQIKAIHLHKCSDLLPSANKFQAVLKLGLRTAALRHSDDPLTADRTTCRKCFTPFSDGHFSVDILPPQRKNWKQIAKYNLSRKHRKQQKKQKQQMSLVQYLTKRTSLVAKYTCLVCSFKTKVAQKKVKQPQPTIAVPLATEKKKGKKRSKTDHMSVNGNENIPANNMENGETSENGKPQAPNSLHLTRPPKRFEPKDFRTIQQMLTDKMSSKEIQRGAQNGKGKKKKGKM